MSDPFNTGETIGSGDVNAPSRTDEVGAGNLEGVSGGGNLAGDRGLTPTEAELQDQIDDTVEQLEEMGAGRERFASMEDLQQSKIDARNAAAEAEAQEQADREAREQAEAAKDAAREEAHANGEAFLEDEYTVGGETHQEWSLPDGTVITVNEAGEAVSVEWPEGEGPVYIGDVLVDGEPCAVYLLPTDTQIVVDSDGNTIGTLDEVDVDDMSVPLYWVTKDKEDVGETVVVELIPDSDGSYDTQIVDATTGEVIGELDTGGAGPGVALGQDDIETYQTYVPPGADYYVVIDEDGNVVGTHPVPEQPEWSVLGIVEYYEDGGVTIDLGPVEIEVDVVGPDGGITVDLDLLIAEGTAGVEWNEDGSWDFDTSVEFDAGGASIEAGFGFGQDADGMWHVDAETWMEMQIGILTLEGGQHAHFQQTPDGFEANVGWEGRVESFGFYVERQEDLTFVLDEDGTRTTYSNTYGAGHELIGGVEVTNEFQVRTSEDGLAGNVGMHGAIVDGDGDVQIQGGAYADTEHGLYTDEEKMDDGRDYERQYRDANLPNALGDDAEARGNADVDRFGLGADSAGDDESADDESTGDGGGPADRFGREGTETRMNVEIGMAATRGGGGPSDEVPDIVAAAVSGRYGALGDSADGLLGTTYGGDSSSDLWLQDWVNSADAGGSPSPAVWRTSGIESAPVRYQQPRTDRDGIDRPADTDAGGGQVWTDMRPHGTRDADLIDDVAATRRDLDVAGGAAGGDAQIIPEEELTEAPHTDWDPTDGPMEGVTVEGWGGRPAPEPPDQGPPWEPEPTPAPEPEPSPEPEPEPEPEASTAPTGAVPLDDDITAGPSGGRAGDVAARAPEPAVVDEPVAMGRTESALADDIATVPDAARPSPVPEPVGTAEPAAVDAVDGEFQALPEMDASVVAEVVTGVAQVETAIPAVADPEPAVFVEEVSVAEPAPEPLDDGDGLGG